MSVIIITHDLGVVAEIADRVILMYAGRMMEYGTVADIFNEPLHPYTKGLMESIPRINANEERLKSIEGTLPDLYKEVKGCRFADRCSFAVQGCFGDEPPLIEVDNRKVRCLHYAG
jgi:oligopeptide/dipeptide ABC transporter ATP-binding protein